MTQYSESWGKFKGNGKKGQSDFFLKVLIKRECRINRNTKIHSCQTSHSFQELIKLVSYVKQDQWPARQFYQNLGARHPIFLIL